MEESSQKRGERLQSMRADASHQSQTLSSSSSSSPIQDLSNPLINTTVDERTPKTPRFDYYTDPMATFSGSKTRSSSPHSFSSPIRSHSPLSHSSNRPNGGAGGGYYRPPESFFSPWNRPNGGGCRYYLSPESFSSPIRSPSCLLYPNGPRNYHTANAHPSAGLQFQTDQSPDQSPWRSPIPFQNPFPRNFRGTLPSYSSNTNASHPNYPFRGGFHQNPSFRQGGSPSPHSNSGRGNQSQFRGRKGHGFRHINCSSQYDPQHFYKAVMKDPWRKLKPIVGVFVPRNGSESSWLPKSIAEPKRAAKVAESGGGKYKLSLAESLALALDEVASDEEKT